MCFSFEASAITFSLGTIFSLINLFIFRNNVNYTFINIYWFGAIIMQLWESFIWKDINCKLFSKVAMITNILQPIVYLLALPQLIKEKGKNILFIIIAIYFVYFYYIIKNYNIPTSCIKKNDGIHLNWWSKNVNGQKNYGGFIYVITVLLLSSLVFKKFLLASQSFYFLFTLFISFFIYGKSNIGSLWCFFAAFAPIFNFIVFKSLGN